MESKICSKCELDKSLSEFNKNKNTKDGHSSNCRECIKLAKQIYYQINKQKILDKVKQYSEQNKNTIKDKQNEYYKLNKELLNNKHKKYYQKNKDSIKKYIENYRLVNSKMIKDSNSEYRKNNKEKIKKSYKKAKIKRLQNDPLFRLRESIANNIRSSFKRNNHIKKSTTQEILGCSFKEFKQHLESLWESWMNWDNYGNPKDGILEPNKTWDIDHIIPSSKSVSENDIIKLNHYSNLQPLCSYYNRNIKRDN
jgi:hypothetical protein